MSLSNATNAMHRAIEELFCRQLTKNENERIWKYFSRIALTATNELLEIVDMATWIISIAVQQWWELHPQLYACLQRM